MRELQQAQRARGTEGNFTEPDVALDENISYQANDNENDFEMEGQPDAAVVDNNDYQAYNNGSHSVVDASVGEVANIGAVETPINVADIANEVAEKTIITTQANNDDVNHDEVEVNAPVGDGSITAFAALNRGQLDDMNVGTITEDNNENHDEVNAPGDGSVTAIAALNHGQLDDVNVGTTTEYNNENYEVPTFV